MRAPTPKSTRDSLAEATYVIMRKLHSYRLEHFFSITKPLFASQFFGLLRLINQEADEEKKMMAKAKKKGKKK